MEFEKRSLKLPSMLIHIKRKKAEEFFTGERCYITELLNDICNPDLSIARCRVEVGVVTQLHLLRGTRETYFIESGCGTMSDGAGDEFDVSEGDSIEIAADHPQQITNTGTSDLIFKVICRPRFLPECYVNLEKENKYG